MCISIEVLKARETFASMCTTLPNLMGFLKLRLSTLAVILGKLQCLPAAMPAAMSIQYINRPPIRLPKVLVSFGSTISFIMVKLSDGFLGSICSVIFGKSRGEKELMKSFGDLSQKMLNVDENIHCFKSGGNA